MNLQKRLMEDMKVAMKAKAVERLGVIRLIRSDIKNYEIDHGPADDLAVVKIIKTMLKQQLDALNDFHQAKREDLITETKIKIEILKSYLPEQLSDQDLEIFISQFVSDNLQKDFGPLMGQLSQQLATKADGAQIATILKKVLKQ